MKELNVEHNINAVKVKEQEVKAREKARIAHEKKVQKDKEDR